ncbi:NAD(P)-binding protein [Backusella circina FSU 941]|nr:NAD(P)-binding protein [Backusella circina FSU 941]
MLSSVALKQASRPSILSKVAASTQVRAMHDLTLRKKTGQPMIKYGKGGRSSTNGHIATVFGCTGFLGRYVVNKLAQQGTQVVVAYRDPDEARHLKVTGDLGQIIPLEFDLKNKESLNECLRHSDIVYNLVGRDYETKNFTFENVHVDGSRALAELAAENGVARFVQVSALNAAEDSASKFLRTKALGEKAVREIIPDATIVRPGILYGHEDRFLNRIGSDEGWQFYVNQGNTKIYPTYVGDVAKALEIMLTAESTMGKTYELYGTKQYAYKDIFELAREISMKDLPIRNLPNFAAKLIATGLDKLPYNQMISPDLIERMMMDDKPTKDALTFADLYINPTELESVAIHYLRRFRSNAVFDLPFEKGEGKIEKGVYHLID